MTDDLRIAFVTDLHLSGTRPYYQDNWELVLEWIEEETPDLVVVGGDVVLSDPDDEGDHEFARAQLDRIPTPWLVIPGNHDVGENIVSGGKGQKKVDEARRRRWLDLYGPDFWRRDVGEWTLIGVNAQIVNGDGLAADEEQKAFLAEAAAATPDDRPIALFVHKPLFMDHPSETDVHGHCLELHARRQLLAPFADKRLVFTACGHKHQYRSFGMDGLLHIWAPATSSINFPPDVKMWGLREVGFIDFSLGQGERLGRVRQRLIGRDFLFRHESYIRNLEYGHVMKAPPVDTKS